MLSLLSTDSGVASDVLPSGAGHRTAGSGVTASAGIPPGQFHTTPSANLVAPQGEHPPTCSGGDSTSYMQTTQTSDQFSSDQQHTKAQMYGNPGMYSSSYTLSVLHIMLLSSSGTTWYKLP